MDLSAVKKSLQEINTTQKKLLAVTSEADGISLNFQNEFIKAWKNNTSILVISEAGLEILKNLLRSDDDSHINYMDLARVDDIYNDVKDNIHYYSIDNGEQKRKAFICLSGLSADSSVSLTCSPEHGHVNCALRIPTFSISCNVLLIDLKKGTSEFLVDSRRRMTVDAMALPFLINKGVIEEYETIEDLLLKYSI